MSVIKKFIAEAFEDCDDDHPERIAMTAVCKAVVEATRESNPEAKEILAEAREFLDFYKSFVVIEGGFAKGVVGVYGPYTQERARGVLEDVGREQGVVCEIGYPSPGSLYQKNRVHISFDGSGKVCVNYTYSPSEAKGSSHKLTIYNKVSF